MIENHFENILSRFRIAGEAGVCTPFGSGHIHDTYLVRTVSGENSYILQRVNHKIFRNVPAMMENIQRVTAHIRQKLEQTPGADPDRGTLTIVPATNGLPYYLDEAGNYWRIFVYIEPHQSFDLATDKENVREAGKAYGRFMNLLSDLGGEPLHETIPNFHNIDMRLELFEESLRTGNRDRIREAPDEIRVIRNRAEEMTLFRRLSQAGQIPTRITHNDTKINNVLFTPGGKALCVIDLDTVMPGLVHYDFGDAMRTFTNTAAEDEADTSKVSMNIANFESFAEGYLGETAGILSAIEKEHLALAAEYFTYLHVLRFLTDYFMNDIYYKTHYPEHNLVRARNQHALLKSMDEQFYNMKTIVGRLS